MRTGQFREKDHAPEAVPGSSGRYRWRERHVVAEGLALRNRPSLCPCVSACIRVDQDSALLRRLVGERVIRDTYAGTPSRHGCLLHAENQSAGHPPPSARSSGAQRHAILTSVTEGSPLSPGTGAARGSVKEKVLPTPGASLSTPTSPPCCAMIVRPM